MGEPYLVILDGAIIQNTAESSESQDVSKYMKEWYYSVGEREGEKSGNRGYLNDTENIKSLYLVLH